MESPITTLTVTQDAADASVGVRRWHGDCLAALDDMLILANRLRGDLARHDYPMTPSGINAIVDSLERARDAFTEHVPVSSRDFHDPAEDLPPEPAIVEAMAAKSEADRRAAVIAGMSAAERKKLIADTERFLSESAPTMEAATADLLALLMAVAAEFVTRYFPAATGASFHVSEYDDSGYSRSHSMINMPVPKGGVK